MRNNLIHETNPSAPFNQFLPRQYREGTQSLQRGSSLPHFEQRRSKSIENVHSEANQVAASMRDVHLKKRVEDRWQQDLDKWKEKRCGANADLLRRKSQRENLVWEQGAGLHNGHSRNFLGTQLENGGSSRKPEFGKARAYGSLDRHSRLADYPPSTESYRTLLNRQTPSSAYHNVTTVDAPVASRLSNPNESSQARVQMVRQSPALSNSLPKPLDKPPVPRNEPIAEDSDGALYRGYLKGGRSSTESRIDVEPSSKVHVPRVLTTSQAFEGIARVDPIDDSESTAKTVRSSVMLTLSRQQHTEPKSIGEQESKTAPNFDLKTQQSAWQTKSTQKVIPHEVTSHDEVDFPRRQPSQATSWQQRWGKDQERRRMQEEQCRNEDEERKQKQEEWERSVKEQHQKEEQILADAQERRNVAQMQRQKDEHLKRERLQKLERRYEVERLQSLEEEVEEEGDMTMRGKEEEEKKLDDSDQRNCSKDFDSSTSPKEGRLDGAKDVVEATAESTSPNPYLLHHSPTDSMSRVRRTSWRSQTIEQDPLRSPALLPPCTSLNGNDQGQASQVNRHTWRSPNLTPPYTLLCANDQGRARLVNQQSLKSPTLNPPYTSLFGDDKGRATPVNRYTLKSPTLIPPYISLYGNGQGRASPVNEITLRSKTLSRSYTSLHGNDQGRASPVNRHTLKSPTLIPPYISLCGNGQGRASPVNEIRLRSQTLSPSYTSPDGNGHIRASPLNRNTMSTALSMPDISLSSNNPEQTSTMNLHSWHENTNATQPSNGKGSIFSRTNQGSLTSHTKPPKKLNTKAKNCKSCRKSIARGMAMHISSLNIYFHMDCFKCSSCDQSLGPKQGGLDVLIMSEKLFCHPCYAIVKDAESRAQKR